MKHITTPPGSHDVLITGREVDAILGISRSTRNRLRDTCSAFPQPYRLHAKGRAIRWSHQAVMEFKASLPLAHPGHSKESAHSNPPGTLTSTVPGGQP